MVAYSHKLVDMVDTNRQRLRLVYLLKSKIFQKTVAVIHWWKNISRSTGSVGESVIYVDLGIFSNTDCRSINFLGRFFLDR